MSYGGQSDNRARRGSIFRSIFYLVILINVWRSLLSPFVEQYYYLAGGSVLLLGMLEGVLEFSTTFPPLLGLLVLRRYGLGRAVMLSIVLDLVGLILFLSGSPPLVLASIALWSFSRMRAPAVKSAVAYASEEKGQAFGLLETATGFVSAACPALALLTLMVFGTAAGLRCLTLAATALSFASLLVAIFGLRDLARPMHSGEDSVRRYLSSFRWGLGILRTPLLAFVLLEGVEGLGYLYPVVALDYGCEPWLWGLAISASVLASTPAPMLAGKLLDRAGGKAAPVEAFMLCTAALLACSLVLPRYFWAFYVAIVFCGTALQTLIDAYIAYTYGSGEREEVYAVLDSLGAVAASIVALTAGLTYTACKVSVFLLGVLMLTLVTIIISIHTPLSHGNEASAGRSHKEVAGVTTHTSSLAQAL